jgi:hypothetical protein
VEAIRRDTPQGTLLPLDSVSSGVLVPALRSEILKPHSSCNDWAMNIVRVNVLRVKKKKVGDWLSFYLSFCLFPIDDRPW